MLTKYFVPLYWWSGKYQCNQSFENFGDLLSKEIIEKLTSKKVIWVYPNSRKVDYIFKKSLLAVGSIIHNAEESSMVWGSGILNKNLPIKKAKYLAVRGPISYEILNSKGIQTNKVFGDPALLVPKLFPTLIKKQENQIGLLPNHKQFSLFKKYFQNDNSDINLINPLDSPTNVIQNILKCKIIYSSSLHGLIIATAYGIPFVYLKLIDEYLGIEELKFLDFFNSMGMSVSPLEIQTNEVVSIYNSKVTEKFITFTEEYTNKVGSIASDLLDVFPHNF